MGPYDQAPNPGMPPNPADVISPPPPVPQLDLPAWPPASWGLGGASLGDQQLQPPAPPVTPSMPDWTHHAFGPLPEQAPPQPESPSVPQWTVPAFGPVGMKDEPVTQGPVGLAPPTAPKTPEQADAADVANKSNEQLAVDKANREQQRANLGAQETLDMLKQDKIAQEANIRNLQNAHADADAARNKVEQEAKNEVSVDRGRAWANKSTSGKIASIADAIIGGFLSPYRGGQNSGIDRILHEQEQDIAVQQQDLQNRRADRQQRLGIIASQVEKGQDLYRAAEVTRVAQLQTLEEDVKAKMQLYDPQGTQYQRAAEALKSVQAAKAMALEESRRRAFDEFIKKGDLGVAQSNAHTNRLNAQWTHEDRQAELGQKAAELEAKKQETADKGVVWNTITGKPVGHVRGGTDAEVADARKKFVAYTQRRNKVANLESLMREYGTSYQGLGADLGLLTDQQKANLNSALAEVRAEYGRDLSGASVAPQQQKMIDQMFPNVEGWTTRSSPAETIHQWLKREDQTAGTALIGAGLDPKDVDTAITQIDTVQKREAPAPAKDPAAFALNGAEGAKTTEDRVSMLEKFDQAAGRHPESVVGEDVKGRVGTVAAAILNDPAATADQKNAAKRAMANLNKYNSQVETSDRFANSPVTPRGAHLAGQ